jgi:hypothetical protein
VGEVTASVDAFLGGRVLEGRVVVLGAIARALAGQLDNASAAGSARGLSATPPIARRLVQVLAEIEQSSPDRAAGEQMERHLAVVRGLAG